MPRTKGKATPGKKQYAVGNRRKAWLTGTRPKSKKRSSRHDYGDANSMSLLKQIRGGYRR